MNFVILSPLEQFEILPLFSLSFFNFKLFIVTNQLMFSLVTPLLVLFVFLFLLKSTNNSVYIIPSRVQTSLEYLYNLNLNLTLTNIKDSKNYLFFPVIIILFIFVVMSNLIGLIPFSFTITSHFIITLLISLSIFMGINILAIRKHGLKLFALFLPSGTSIVLGFLLVPIEIISYIFKPLSLATRLFCNMMAGHTLLKVIAGFVWSIMTVSSSFFFIHYLPFFFLLPLFCLEFFVALIQAFVFSLLICIYINDAINLH